MRVSSASASMASSAGEAAAMSSVLAVGASAFDACLVLPGPPIDKGRSARLAGLVDSSVLTTADELQVLDPVVEDVAVPVVDVLGGIERSTEVLCHDQAVLGDVAVVIGHRLPFAHEDQPVAIPGVADPAAPADSSLPSPLALNDVVAIPRAVLPIARGERVEGFAADLASHLTRHGVDDEQSPRRLAEGPR